MNRRTVILTGAAALVLAPAANAASDATMAAIAEYTGGAEPAEGGIVLTAPEIAENGNTVPIEVSAPGAESIAIFADGNPLPGVATFAFGPLSAEQFASTRIRLARTQDLIAVAKMPDGTYQQAMATVKVTIGGCGG